MKKEAAARQLEKLMKAYPPGYCSLADYRPDNERPKVYDLCIKCNQGIEITGSSYFEKKPYGPFDEFFLGTSGCGDLDTCCQCPTEEICFYHFECLKQTTDCSECSYCDECIVKQDCFSCQQPFGTLENISDGEYYDTCQDCREGKCVKCKKVIENVKDRKECIVCHRMPIHEDCFSLSYYSEKRNMTKGLCERCFSFFDKCSECGEKFTHIKEIWYLDYDEGLICKNCRRRV